MTKRSIEKARTFFARVGTDLTAGLGHMYSGIREITLNERLRLFHDFFRMGQKSAFTFNRANRPAADAPTGEYVIGQGGVAISHRTGFETAARPVWYTDI